MANKWSNGGEHTVVDVRPGGAGNNWRILDVDGMLDAISGGGRARTTLWGRDASGIAPRGFIYTGNPNDFTANMSYPLTAKNFLDDVLFKCAFDARARQRCDRLDDMVNYGNPGIIGLLEATNNDFSASEAIANPDGVEGDLKWQMAIAATALQKYTLVAHDDISKTTSDADINRVLSIGAFRCAGACGPGKSEEDEWLAVTDRDSTPGYSGNAVARLLYTRDRWVTRGSVAIDLFTQADATDVVFLGDRIVVFSPDKAPAYASYQDILNGVTAPNLWASMTGFAGIAAGNFPGKASAPNASTIFMVGAGGRIWKSTDAGISATLIDNGATTSQNLTTVDFQSDVLGFIGGAAGTLLRYYNGAITVLPVADADGNALTATINRVRVPSKREAEVYLGTAGGEVWRSRNASDTRPSYENLAIPLKGVGSITDIDFAGYRGDQMYIVQTSADGTSRVLRDHSGGACGADIKVIGAFDSPSNFKFNSIAMANVNMGITVGNIHEQYGFIGMLRPNLI